MYLSAITILELETGILLIERRDSVQGALVHGMTVVTRNIADFAATGVMLLNPWQKK